jgi:hypothetical protein
LLQAKQEAKAKAEIEAKAKRDADEKVCYIIIATCWFILKISIVKLNNVLFFRLLPPQLKRNWKRKRFANDVFYFK